MIIDDVPLDASFNNIKASEDEITDLNRGRLYLRHHLKKLANVQIFETVEAATSKLVTDYKGMMTDKALMDVS